MEENQKSKKESVQKKLIDLEEDIKIQDQKQINELIKKIGDFTFSLDDYTEAIHTELSFNITIKLIDEPQ